MRRIGYGADRASQRRLRTNCEGRNAPGVIQLQAIERFSPNHGPRPEPARIDMLVIHYTGMTTAEAALDRLCDPDARVSAHYVIVENGAIWRLVPENRRAFHAGVPVWEGEGATNAVAPGADAAPVGARRIGWSVIRILRRSARAIPASCSTGPGSPAPASGSGHLQTQHLGVSPLIPPRRSTSSPPSGIA